MCVLIHELVQTSTFSADPENNCREMLATARKSNRPFQSSLVHLFQNESSWQTFHMKMSLICIKMKLQSKHILIWMVSYEDSFRQRQKVTRKWPLHSKMVCFRTKRSYFVSRLFKLWKPNSMSFSRSLGLSDHFVLITLLRQLFIGNRTSARKKMVF